VAALACSTPLLDTPLASALHLIKYYRRAGRVVGLWRFDLFPSLQDNWRLVRPARRSAGEEEGGNRTMGQGWGGALKHVGLNACAGADC
jgi:hypothetical protein